VLEGVFNRGFPVKIADVEAKDVGFELGPRLNCPYQTANGRRTLQIQIERHGEDALIRLPEDIVRQLGWTEDTVVSMETDGKSIIVKRLEQQLRPDRDEALKDTVARRADALRKLAE
jgi:antitoxin component of MazEF toxin-antitoxin module